MNGPLENLYFNWLYSKVADGNARSPSLTFTKLFKQLHTTEFVWIVMCDDSRAADGIDLRIDFFRERFIKVDNDFMSEPCSVLEMLVALAYRCSFQTDDSASSWFWIFMDNLHLTECTDNKRHNETLIGDIVDQLIWRTYEENGFGGLFPLERPKSDQRQVELWYQMHNFIIENALV